MNAFNKILFIISEHQKKRSVLLLILLIFGMAFEILGIGILVPVLTSILKPETLLQISSIKLFFETINLTQETEIIKFSLFSLVLLYFIKSIYLLSLNYFQNRFNSNLTADISNRLFKKYLEQPYKFHLKRNSSELIKNFQIEVGYFNIFLLAFIILITEITLIIAVLVSLIYIEPLGTFIVILFFLLFSSIFFITTRRLSTRWGEIRERNDNLISKILLESFGGIKEILLLNRAGGYFSRFHKFNSVKASIASKNVTLGQVPRYYLEFLSIIALVVFILTLFSQGRSTDDLLVTLGVFVAATFRILPSINRILSSLQQLKYYKLSIDILYEEFKTLKDKSNSSSEHSNEFTLSNTIVFKDLDFCYDQSSSVVLKKLNLQISKGSTTGIIGASGSGKSTLINLLVGLLTPTSGRIEIDGEELDLKNIESWRKNIGYVSQHVYLSDNSILENIAFGIEPKEISIDRIDHVLKEAQLSELIDSLPEGYHTKVGERGVQLSGGQQQRIGIARALYNDPEVLILDEATSALDVKTEKSVMEAVDSLKNRKTILIVTHRLTTLEGCDSIFEIEKGSIRKTNNQAVHE